MIKTDTSLKYCLWIPSQGFSRSQEFSPGEGSSHPLPIYSLLQGIRDIGWSFILQKDPCCAMEISPPSSENRPLLHHGNLGHSLESPCEAVCLWCWFSTLFRVTTMLSSVCLFVESMARIVDLLPPPEKFISLFWHFSIFWNIRQFLDCKLS